MSTVAHIVHTAQPPRAQTAIGRSESDTGTGASEHLDMENGRGGREGEVTVRIDGQDDSGRRRERSKGGENTPLWPQTSSTPLPESELSSHTTSAKRSLAWSKRAWRSCCQWVVELRVASVSPGGVAVGAIACSRRERDGGRREGKRAGGSPGEGGMGIG